MSERLREVLEEIKKRQGILAVYDFVDRNFPRQAQILSDNSRFQWWLFTRRFGKSRTFAKKGCSIAANKPNSKTLYLALTLDSAKGILWDAVEQELQEKKIAYKGFEREGIFDFKNGSLFRMFGVDSNYKEMKKILGQGYDLVGLDESGSMTIDVEELIMQMILAALSDRQGSLVMLGTAENIPNTFYQRVTNGLETSLPWSGHKGLTQESPYTGPQFQSDMELILKNNPLAAQTSWFRTHWLNEWCADDDLLIIRHGAINETTIIPSGELFYCLGVDLGFNDASSFTVCAYTRNDPNLYVLESFKESGLDFTDVAKVIRSLQSRYEIHQIIVDGSAKQGVEELRNRHQLSLTAAEKQDKSTFLRALNDDYKQGRILVHAEKSKQLIQEQSQLMWLKDSEGKEDPRCENHCNDSLLYAWRHCKNYMFKPEVTEWKPLQERMEDEFKKESKEMLNRENETAFLY
jgi:hypothetical protein